MVEPYDEPRISAEETIIRRISEHYIVPDENTGSRRISKMAFQPSSIENGGMSVDILGLIVQAGLEPKGFVTTPVFTGSVKFTADFIRKLDLWIGYEPNLPDNPYHGEVWGNPRPNRFTDGQKKALLRGCDWYVEIPDVILGAK